MLGLESVVLQNRRDAALHTVSWYGHTQRRTNSRDSQTQTGQETTDREDSVNKKTHYRRQTLTPHVTMTTDYKTEYEKREM